MENASNALIIAGTILIALIILTIGVYLAASHRGVQESYIQRLTIQEVEQFNSKFLAFENRTNITAHEIVTLIEFAQHFKEKNGVETKILINGVDYTNKNDYDKVKFIKNNSPEVEPVKYTYYECNDTDIQYDNQTGRVTEIKFKKL